MRILREGQDIRGTYEVERFLGNGAFAEVYRVKHRFLGRQAMKVFKMTGISLAETEELLGEAVMLSRFGHPNIIRVFDANIVESANGSRGFFTMEYVAGGTLEQFWRSHGGRFVPIETSVDILQQICRGIGVGHMESPPIIHRDIKPQNVLIGYDVAGLRAKVSDFGLAKQVNPLTLLATAKGTRAFKPPEVFKPHGADSCAADVWALGSILYLLLTDRLPYAKLTKRDSQEPCFDEPLTLPSRVNIQVNEALDNIALKALSLEAEDRYPTAMEMLEDLSHWENTPVSKKRLKAPLQTDESKIALGPYKEVDAKVALTMAKKAFNLARHAGQLMEAADLMEEAFNKAPELRDEYEYQLRLWRRGVVM